MASHVVVLLDDNMYYRSMRREVFNVVKEYRAQGVEVGYLSLFLTCSVEVATRRNSVRSGEALLAPEVIAKMAASLEAPAEGWEANALRLDQNNPGAPLFSLGDIIARAPAAMNAVQEAILQDRLAEEKHAEAERQKAIGRESWSHHVDLALRRAVSALMKQQPGPRTEVAELLNKKRKELLEELKNGGLTRYQSMEEAAEQAVNKLVSTAASHDASAGKVT